ncbi:MAG TPA: hypothetical protein PLL30_15965 [Candidatus Krumholzibacteria bacterium]|nr:hypothetical protein [Candidatus Krumholzibacteria bacterium]HPD73267.1 hypothetical protein [Candidatus Krumholzibacteria bacterium]HRY40229.1 hypothetical protein [Candidatus Krumholzibacteria bacterium]
MRTILVIALFTLLAGGSPAAAQDWVALWRIGDSFFGMAESGDVYRHDPATGETEFVGSFGAGAWVSFGRQDDLLLALKSDGEVWTMPASTATAVLTWALPADRSWCALQQHPDTAPWCAISCDGEVWRLDEPQQLLADFGLFAAGPWICIATADDSFIATMENGDTWQGYGEYFEPSGTYGPGPWVGFSRTYGLGGEFLALNPGGEIWAHDWSGNPSLYLALPADREWCALLSGPVWNSGPGYALTCAGEIWSVESTPAQVGTFALPVPVEQTTWGRLKNRFR